MGRELSFYFVRENGLVEETRNELPRGLGIYSHVLSHLLSRDDDNDEIWTIPQLWDLVLQLCKSGQTEDSGTASALLGLAYVIDYCVSCGVTRVKVRYW